MLRRRTNHFVTALGAVLVLSAPGILVAGERVEVKSSTTIELPRPRDIEFKGGASKDLQTPAPVGGGFITPAQPANSAIINKELRKLQDKRDNWIFMRPEEILMDNKTAAFFKDKDDNPSLLEFKGTEKEKNAQEKYFEERRTGNNPDSDRNDQKTDLTKARSERNRRDIEKKDNERGSSTFVFGENGRNGFEGRFSSFRSTPEAISKNELGGPIKAPDFLDHSFGGSIESRAPALFQKEEIKKQAEQRDADFMKLIQPRSSLPGTSIPGMAGALDPLNTQVDSTRIDVNPVTPRRGEAATLSDRPSFMGGDGVPSFRSELSGSGIGDLLPKAPATSSSFAPSANSPVSAPSAINSSRPFVFEMPRRAF